MVARILLCRGVLIKSSLFIFWVFFICAKCLNMTLNMSDIISHINDEISYHPTVGYYH